MTDLHERMHGIDRLAPPDLWEAAQRAAHSESRTGSRPSVVSRVTVALVALTVGLGAVAWVVTALRMKDAPGSAADRVASPAPRADCPIRIDRAGRPPISASELDRLTGGHLPRWLPDGFGLLAAFGPDRALDGAAADAVWSDVRCREVALSFNPNWVAGEVGWIDPLASVGPWVVSARDGEDCDGPVAGDIGCLAYSTTTTEGSFSLRLVGLARVEGDRIALSIISGGAPPLPDRAPPLVAVPELAGKTLVEAEALLGNVGLEAAPVYIAHDDVTAGRVTDTEPDRGTDVTADTSVWVYVSAGPDGGGHVWAGSLVRQHPDVFIGNFRGRDSYPVLAVGPDVDLGAWRERIERSADGRPFDVVRCPVDRAQLEVVTEELLSLVNGDEFEPNGVGFGIDPGSCSVFVEGSFSGPEIASLRERFGDLVTLVDGVRSSALLPDV